MKKKKVKPAELVEAAIERIERHKPQLNGVVFKASALEQDHPQVYG